MKRFLYITRYIMCAWIGYFVGEYATRQELPAVLCYVAIFLMLVVFFSVMDYLSEKKTRKED